MPISETHVSGTVGVGMVGAGFAARFHAQSYRRVHEMSVRLRAVHTRRAEAGQEFAAEHGFETGYPDLASLLQDPEVDLVDVCVPAGFHEEVVTEALRAGKHVVVEKPFTGSFVPGENAAGWQKCLEAALSSANGMREAERDSGRRIMYAENWVYAPGVQKARRLLAAAETPILRIVGEESHSGTHSPYGMQWATSGGGSLLMKGCHPLGAALYLKYDEGVRRLGQPIRASWVVGTTANLTHGAAFASESDHLIRTGWTDCEDWGTMVVGFDDGSVAQITAADTVVGGIQSRLSVYAGQATLHVNISPNDSVLAYSADAQTFADEYIREKVETTAGWQFTNPDEDWMNGFPNEMQDFCEVALTGREPVSGSSLGWDVVAVCYSAYLSAATGTRVDVPRPE